MSAPRVLLLSPFFHPEPISTGRYNGHLARALVAAGCHVEVVCSHPLYPDWRPRRSEAVIDGVTIHRAGLRARYPGSAMPRRLVLEAWFCLHACRMVWRLRQRIDVIVPVFPPELFMLLLPMGIPARTPCVGIVHDIQGIMMTGVDSRLRRLVGRVIRALEGRVFRRCDRLICLSASMQRALCETHDIDRNRTVVRYPFVSLPEEHGASGATASLLPDGWIHVVYSGALGEKQRPRELLDFFEAVVSRRDDVRCHVFSRGATFHRLSESVRPESRDRILFHDLVADDEIVDLYHHSTIQVIPQAAGTGAGAFPSKLPNLIAAGVPVFAICDAASELASVVIEAGVGKVTGESPSEDWPVLLDALIAETAGEDHARRARRSRAFVEGRFGVGPVVADILGAIRQ